MANVSTNIKIDPQLKEEAQSVLEDLGLSLSAAVNIFLRQTVRERAIPFRIGEPARSLNRETLEALREAEEMAQHPEKYRRYASFGDLLREVRDDV